MSQEKIEQWKADIAQKDQEIPELKDECETKEAESNRRNPSCFSNRRRSEGEVVKDGEGKVNDKKAAINSAQETVSAAKTALTESKVALKSAKSAYKSAVAAKNREAKAASTPGNKEDPDLSGVETSESEATKSAQVATEEKGAALKDAIANLKIDKVDWKERNSGAESRSEVPRRENKDPNQGSGECAESDRQSIYYRCQGQREREKGTE